MTISDGVDISEVRGCHLIRQMISQWRLQKIFQELVSHELIAYVSVFDLFLTQWIMAILSKGCKPDNFESHISLKLSFTNIRDRCSNFVECESFLESNSPDNSCFMRDKLGWLYWFGNFSVRGYLPLIWKDFTTHINGFADYLKEGLPFARDVSLENSAGSYSCFRLALLHSVSYLFFMYWSPSWSLCTVFYSVYLT